MKWQIGISILLFFFSSNNINAQGEKTQKWQLSGYISDMVTSDWSTDSMHLNNLVHQRLNFKWFPNNNFTFYLELRSRLFAGHSVLNIPSFGEIVDANNDYLDLSIQFPKDKKWLFQSMVDRAYLEWYKNDWEIRLGRQRINWGINLVWNPNDLFNAYSFFDVDYSERPGSDALRIKKYIGFASSLELASNMAVDFDEVVLASIFRWNKWNYDFQIIGAKAKQDIAVGVAWAGNLRKAGFKGEATFFQPYKEQTQINPLLMMVISADYAFKNTIYLHTGILYNSDGSDELNLSGFMFSNSGSLSARNLSPFAWSIFLQTTYQFHPLVTGGISTIYYPGQRNALFINPNLNYSLKENLDLSFILQWYYDELSGKYEAFGRLFYLRAKWNF